MMAARARLTRTIVPGVHRLQHAYVNCYLVEDASGVTIVDAAHPSTWPMLLRALRAIGRPPADVKALVLTHAHFDHLGFARQAQEEWGIPVLAHPEEEHLARHPYRYAHENPRLLYPLRHPAGVRPLLGMLAAGAWHVKGVEQLEYFGPGDELDVPGHPTVVHSPGHTLGHCALFLPGSSSLLSGDALVTFDPYTGGSGPQIVSGAATADSAEALISLRTLAATGARTVLPGHGSAWVEGVQRAAELAYEAGPS